MNNIDNQKTGLRRMHQDKEIHLDDLSFDAEDVISLHKKRDVILKRIFQNNADLLSQQPSVYSNQPEHIADKIQQNIELIDISNTSDEEMEENIRKETVLSDGSDTSYIVNMKNKKTKHEQMSNKFLKSRSSNSSISYNSSSSSKNSFHRKTIKQKTNVDNKNNPPCFNDTTVEQKECSLDFYCPHCKIHLSSEASWKCHLVGNRHFKAVKPQHLYEVARNSIELQKNQTFVSFEKSRFGEVVSHNEDYLDRSKGDFHCMVCDSHMNNQNMWEIHLRGNRHLKNTLKPPGESISKVKSFKAASDVIPKLKSLLRREAGEEVVVGLSYIRETQGPNGRIYNCFICGACSTNFDIVDHILSTKHRIKYLEKLLVDGKDNAIRQIKQMDISLRFRDSLIEKECYQMQRKYGKGRVEVYISKNIYKYH